MTQTLWVYSARNNWFTNGKYIITVEVSHRGPFAHVREIYYNDTGVYLHREDLEIGSHRDVRLRLASPWKPKTIKEITQILDSNK